MFNGIIANSGNANAFTHQQGINDAIAMACLLATKLALTRTPSGSLTGVIGRPMNMSWYKDHFEQVFSQLTDKPEGSEKANRAIMTTDLVPKTIAVEIDGGIRIGGIAKGSGMIEPNMGTMLSFLFTDATSASRSWKSASGKRSTNPTTWSSSTATPARTITCSSSRPARLASPRTWASSRKGWKRSARSSPRRLRVMVKGRRSSSNVPFAGR